MINRHKTIIIDEPADLEKYPEKFEKSLGRVTFGDMHGNALKLLYSLLRTRVVKIHPHMLSAKEQYEEFVNKFDEIKYISKSFYELRTQLFNNREQIDKLNKLDHFELDKLGVTEYQVHEKIESLKIENENIENHQISLLESLDSEMFDFNFDFIQIDNPSEVCLLGDELFDRNGNDYITLSMLEFLIDNKIPLSILASNHQLEFILAYENLINNGDFNSYTLAGDSFKASFLGLKLLLESNIITQERLTELYNKIKPSMKLLDCTLGDIKILLLTHAPVRLLIIKAIAHQMQLIYDDSSPEALAKTICKINTKYSAYVNANKVSELVQINSQFFEDPEKYALEYPILYLLWNRWNESKETADARPHEHNGYLVDYGHGHDSFQSKLNHIYNLDTFLGKFSKEVMELFQRQERFEEWEFNYKIINSTQTSPKYTYTVEEIDKEFLDFNRKSNMRNIKRSNEVKKNIEEKNIVKETTDAVFSIKNTAMILFAALFSLCFVGVVSPIGTLVAFVVTATITAMDLNSKSPHPVVISTIPPSKVHMPPKDADEITEITNTMRNDKSKSKKLFDKPAVVSNENAANCELKINNRYV